MSYSPIHYIYGNEQKILNFININNAKLQQNMTIFCSINNLAISEDDALILFKASSSDIAKSGDDALVLFKKFSDIGYVLKFGFEYYDYEPYNKYLTYFLCIKKRVPEKVLTLYIEKIKKIEIKKY